MSSINPDNELAKKQVGTALTGVGGLAFIIGILAGFNRIVILLANLLFFIGILLTLGFDKTKHMFLLPRHIWKTACFVIGILLVSFGHSFWGGAIEIVAAGCMFGGFIPYLQKQYDKFMNRNMELP